MIPLTLAHTLQRSQLIMGGRCFDFSFMVDLVTAVDLEADYRQAWAHIEQRPAAEKETAAS